MSAEAKVKSVMIEDVHQARLESTVRDAASLMVEKDIGCLLVSGSKGPVGIVTERDILRKVTATARDPSKVRVKEIMSTPLISVPIDTPIGDAAKKMIECNIKRLAVTDTGGAFLGLVTMTDIIRWTAQQKELSESIVNYLMFNVP